MSDHSTEPTTHQPASRLVGVLAEFEGPEQLVEACNQARLAGIRKMDAFSPFPVHGIDPAIGIRRTKLPFLVLAVGLGALGLGLGLQFAVNATDALGPFPGYPFRISGKPEFSLPANIPVTFEIIVLSSAFAAFLGMLAMNRLPRFANPLHRIPRFKTATNNGFFLLVEAEDPNYNPRQIHSQLESWGAQHLETVEEDLTDQRMPAFVRSVLVMIAVLCLIPPALIYRAYGETNPLPRLHVVPDMDWQFKSKAQQTAPNIAVGSESVDYIFPSRRVMREQVAGTVTRGQWKDGSPFFTGIVSEADGDAEVRADRNTSQYVTAQQDTESQDPAAQDPAVSGQTIEEPNWLEGFPEQVEISAETIRRGQQRFNIYCAVCHGVTGDGNGRVNERGNALNLTGNAAWINAKSFHDPTIVSQPEGRIFDTITNGRGGMGPYRAQIPTQDRWAIVMYVRALQNAYQDAEQVGEMADSSGEADATADSETTGSDSENTPAEDGDQ